MDDILKRLRKQHKRNFDRQELWRNRAVDLGQIGQLLEQLRTIVNSRGWNDAEELLHPKNGGLAIPRDEQGGPLVPDSESRFSLVTLLLESANLSPGVCRGKRSRAVSGLEPRIP